MFVHSDRALNARRRPLCLVWDMRAPGFEPGSLGLRRVLNRFVKMGERDEGSGLVGTCWKQVPPFVEKTNAQPSRDSWDSFYLNNGNNVADAIHYSLNSYSLTLFAIRCCENVNSYSLNSVADAADTIQYY